LEEKGLELRLKALEDLQGRILACNLCPRLSNLLAALCNLLVVT